MDADQKSRFWGFWSRTATCSGRWRLPRRRSPLSSGSSSRTCRLNNDTVVLSTLDEIIVAGTHETWWICCRAWSRPASARLWSKRGRNFCHSSSCERDGEDYLLNISRHLNLGRQVPRCLHSHKGRVLPHPSFGWKVELQKSMFQFSEDKDINSKINVSRIIFRRQRYNIVLSGSPTTWTAQQPQSCRSRSKPLSSTAPTPRPSTTPGATSD